MNRLAQAWDERSPRERAAIAWGAALLLIALAIAVVWLPLERTRTRLAAELPALRGSLASNAGGLPGAQVAVLDERRVRVSGADVSYAALLEWLRGAAATHGMRVESARLEALPPAGRVRAEITLSRS